MKQFSVSKEEAAAMLKSLTPPKAKKPTSQEVLKRTVATTDPQKLRRMLREHAKQIKKQVFKP